MGFDKEVPFYQLLVAPFKRLFRKYKIFNILYMRQFFSFNRESHLLSFVIRIMNGLKFVYLFLIVFAAGITSCSKKEVPVKFAIASDFHAPDVPGGKERVEAFIKAANDENVDFIIELGDFCRLDSSSQVYREIWNSFEGDKYHAIGNHDLDRYSTAEYVTGMSLPNRYYSFDREGFHFVVLDGNNYFDGEKIIHYDHANYGAYPFTNHSYIDKEQMEWLANDLASTDLKTILFSHQSIESELKNGAEVRSILEKENKRAGFKKVLLAFSGHDHTNYTKNINGIAYMQINSASYVWIGEPTMTEKRFPKEINEKYSLMQYSMMYDKPLYAIVTLTGEGADIKGTRAEFIPPAPVEIGLGDSIGVYPLVSTIEDVYVKFTDSSFNIY